MGVGREGWTQNTEERDSPEAEGGPPLSPSLEKKRKHSEWRPVSIRVNPGCLW